MREFRTSGSVRGRGGNSPVYSTIELSLIPQEAAANGNRGLMKRLRSESSTASNPPPHAPPANDAACGLHLGV